MMITEHEDNPVYYMDKKGFDGSGAKHATMPAELIESFAGIAERLVNTTVQEAKRSSAGN